MDLFRIESERADGPPGVVVVWLEQPGKPVVVLDEALIRTLDRTLDHVPADADGLVLASAAPRSFVAGADLKSIQDLDDAGLHAYLEFGARVFGRLSSFPFPTAAAINAACLGGGLELAMHCDGPIGALPGSLTRSVFPRRASRSARAGAGRTCFRLGWIPPGPSR